MDPLDSLQRVPDLLPPDDEAVLARARTRVLAGVRSRRPAPWGRRALLAGAAVACGVVAVEGVAEPRRASAAGLATAAAEVTDPALLPGQYLRVTTLIDQAQQGAPIGRTVQVVWVPWDRRQVWVQCTTAPDGTVTTVRGALGGVPAVQDYEAVELIARTPAGFRSLLPDWVRPSDPTWSCDGVAWAESLLSSGEVPAAVRAELYRYLASLAGVHQRGTARLASGRTGSVFAADDRWRRARWEVVIDTATGDYLGDRYIDRSPGTPPGGFCTLARAITADVVWSAP